MKGPFGQAAGARRPYRVFRELGGGLSIRLPAGGSAAVLGTTQDLPVPIAAREPDSGHGGAGPAGEAG